MESFEKKSAQELKKLPLKEVTDYYRAERKYQYEQGIPFVTAEDIATKKENYRTVRAFLKADKILNYRTARTIGDERIETGRPRIYACTHIARFDIESVIESIGESVWFLMGDPGETYRNLNGKILDKLGYIPFEMKDPLDRKIAEQRCIEILKLGGNILMFPEAAWCLDPVHLVSKLFPGVVRMAVGTEADVIPTGIEQYRSVLKKYYVNFGKNLNYAQESLEKKEEICEEIRSKMGGLKWTIMEKYGCINRDSLPSDWNEGFLQFINSIMRDTENGYTLEEISETRFHNKIEPKPIEELCSYLSSLKLYRDSHNSQFEQEAQKILKMIKC